MDVDDPLSGHSDVTSHLVNGYCVNHVTPMYSEIPQRVKSPVEMAIGITEITIDGCARGQLSSEDLRVVCSAIGIKPAPRGR